MSEAELKRLKDVFKRSSTLGGYMTQNVFIREVLGDGVPQKLAEVWSVVGLVNLYLQKCCTVTYQLNLLVYFQLTSTYRTITIMQTCAPSVFFRICNGIQPRILKYGFVNLVTETSPKYGNAHHLNIFFTVISCVKNVAPSVGNVHVPLYYARCQATRNIP